MYVHTYVGTPYIYWEGGANNKLHPPLPAYNMLSFFIVSMKVCAQKARLHSASVTVSYVHFLMFPLPSLPLSSPPLPPPSSLSSLPFPLSPFILTPDDPDVFRHARACFRHRGDTEEPPQYI